MRLHRAPLEYIRDLTALYGSHVHVRLGREHIVFCTEPSSFEQILVRDNDNVVKERWLKPRLLRRTSYFSQPGIQAAEAAEHAVERRVLAPSLAHEQVHEYELGVIEEAIAISRRLRHGATVDLRTIAFQYAAGNALRVLLNVSLSDDECRRVASALSVFTRPPAVRSFTHELFAWLNTPQRLRFMRSSTIIDAVVAQAISTNRESAGHNLLASFLANRSRHAPALDDEEILHNAKIFLVTGTVAAALTCMWGIYVVADHPAVETALRREAREKLADERPQPSDVEGLRYARAVVNEVLRLYPPAWMIGRRLRRERRLGGYRIPAGATVVLVPYLVHRDARWFSDPEVFLPERWLEPQPERPKGSFVPFGAGPHLCLGSRLGMLECVVFLSVIFRHWHVRPVRRVGRIGCLFPLQPLCDRLEAQVEKA
jgi:cytochrome P450